MTTSEIFSIFKSVISLISAYNLDMPTIAAFLAAFASISAAIAAWKSSSVSKKTLQHQKYLEQNRVQFLKHQFEVDQLQKLIASFTEINALFFSEWGDERNKNIDRSIREMKFHISALKSLNTSISADIEQWESDENAEFSRMIYYVIGQLHSKAEESYRDFLIYKMEELKKIQDKMFLSISDQGYNLIT